MSSSFLDSPARDDGTADSHPESDPVATADVASSAAPLEWQRAFLEKAQEVAHIGSWSIELNGGGALVWSREMYRILGIEPGRVASTYEALNEIVHPDDRQRVRAARDAARLAGCPYDVEHRVLRGDGAVRWVHTRAETIHDAGGRPIRVIGTMQDVTGRRELEEQLRQAQRIDALGRLAGGLAHDLNNALSIILGYTEAALDETDRGGRLAGDLEEIRAATERAASTVRQLLSFGRKPAGSNRVFQLEESLYRVARMLERLFGSSIVVEIAADSDLPPTWGDPAQVEQAIVNLGINARDAMPSGGHLDLTLSSVEVDGCFVERHPGMTPGRHLVLSISDTGHGMTADVLERIFDPFFTTKPVGRGTGLGLSTVRGTMQELGGAIVAQSTPGLGSTFVLYFPVARQEASDAPAAASGARGGEPAVRPLTVLVVDDEPGMRELVAANLRRAGHRVLVATTGAAAIELSAAEAIDLLVTDLQMPGLTGMELARALRSRRPALRVVVMTGFADDSLALEASEPPIVRLDKPFTRAELQRAVRRAATAPSPAASPD